MSANLQATIRTFWQKRSFLNCLLLPFAGLFWLITMLRYFSYKVQIQRSQRLPVPVIVVGCITAGGGGKTTLVTALVSALLYRGMKPGIISRGHGRNTNQVVIVEDKTDYQQCGDEALLLKQNTSVPVVVGQDRPAAAAKLLETYPTTDVIISDDGLQHYALKRDIEIVVLSDNYALGNQWLMPAGPLRESVSRLTSVDYVVRKGKAKDKEFAMKLKNAKLSNLKDIEIPIADLQDKKIVAVAAIAEPDQFFDDLAIFGIKPSKKITFEDHHPYSKQDLEKIEADFFIMTAKDALKCNRFEDDRILVFTQQTELEADLLDSIVKRINKFKSS